MHPLRQISLILDQRQLLARFWQSASQFWKDKKGRAAGLTIFLIVVALLQLLIQVLLNLWNRNFFDSLERRDAHALWVGSRSAWQERQAYC